MCYLYFIKQSQILNIMTTLKITSVRELAVELSNGSVELSRVSVRLQRVVEMWHSRNEVVIENGIITLK